MYKENIIIALDYDDESKIYEFCDQMDPSLCKLKIGKQVFTKYGPNIIDNLHKKKFEIFLDLKFHDIPTTVYKACLEAFNLGVWMLNIHLLGGTEMINAAKQARDEVNKEAKLIGVTLFAAAYMAEVVRGGLQAIPPGQFEAASALGLGYWKMMTFVILPQSLRIVIPGIVNTFIALFKDTTLVLIIGLYDLLGIIQAATTDPKWLGFSPALFSI